MSEWWKTGVVYQVYPRSFADSNGDGAGDLAGIIGRLDYVADLGVDAIWISPFYPSPMADFGYDVSNYCDVDPIFGTLADFDGLVSGAHARGLEVIVDIVPNHTSDQHPWFAQSRASKDNPKRDWYVWRAKPNNWIGCFGGSAWQFDDRTGEYYLHSFLTAQPDLNYRNPEVRAAMVNVFRFWLDRGVDGFRLDVAQRVMKDPEYRDNPPGEQSGWKQVGAYGSQRHIHDQGHPDVHDVFREWRAVLDEYSRAGQARYAVGEIHEFDWDRWARYYGDNDELHMPFNFAFLKAPFTAAGVRDVVEGQEAALASRPHAWPNAVLGNHDEPRVARRYGAAQARLAMLLLLTLRGTPTLYYGDELGMEGVDVSDEDSQDPWARQVPGLGLSRDTCRTPMQWDYGPNAGFCPPTAKPWLPVEPGFAERNVATQEVDPSSMLSFTKAALRLRRSEPALHSGSYATIAGSPAEVFAFERAEGETTFICALNFSAHMITWDLGGEVQLSTHGSTGAIGRLLPWEGQVIRRRSR